MNALRFLVGMITGALIGAAAGLLFAPRKGERTRRLVKEEVEDFVHDKMDELKSEWKKQLDKISSAQIINGSKEKV